MDKCWGIALYMCSCVFVYVGAHVHMCMMLRDSIVYVFMCVCMYGSMCTHVYGGQKTTSCVVPQEMSILFFRDRSLPSRLGRLTSKPQGSTCFCLPGTGTTSVWHHTCLLYVGSHIWGSNSGPQVFKQAHHWLSYLCSLKGWLFLIKNLSVSFWQEI